jgi:hypothetical protein
MNPSSALSLKEANQFRLLRQEGIVPMRADHFSIVGVDPG